MSNKILVDAKLRDLVPAYLKHRDAELARLRGHLAAGDLDALQKIGHQLCGSGGGYGFARISELGRALERAAAEGRAEEIRKIISDLAGYLGAIELVYE